VAEPAACELRGEVVGGDVQPGGQPSTVAVSAGPWDSPAVR
jgi:hypothetical protein